MLSLAEFKPLAGRIFVKPPPAEISSLAEFKPKLLLSGRKFILSRIGGLPEMRLGIVLLKSFNDLTANKAFHQLLCCLHDEKIRSPFHIEGPLLYFQRSLHFQRHY